MNPNITYKIIPSVRKLLAKPIGTLFLGDISENIVKVKKWFNSEDISNPVIVSVGDIVSNAFLSDPLLVNYLKMCIIDEKTKRGEFKMDTQFSDFQEVRVSNPIGLITPSAMNTIATQLTSDRKSILIVDGEEDLLVLPVILSSPENTYVVYGQPPITDLVDAVPAGLVMIQISLSIKKFAQDLLNQFEKL